MKRSCMIVVLLVALSASGCSCSGNPILGTWQSEATGTVVRIEAAEDGSIEGIAIARDEARLVAWYLRDNTEEERRFWSAEPARECLLRRGALGIVLYRGLRRADDGFEGESRNRGTTYSGWAGCQVTEEWVRRRFVIRDGEVLEVRDIGSDEVLSSFRRAPASSAAH